MEFSSFMAKRSSGVIVENIKTIVYAILIAIGIRTVAYEPFNIPSGSMIPTLLVGDFLFVSKYSYGYSRYSTPVPSWLPFAGRLFGSTPARGDVAVFKLPRDNETDYIKRIVGLPGDRIQMIGGQLYVNGTIVPRRDLGEYVSNDRGRQTMAKRYSESLPGGRQHDILKLYEQGGLNDTPIFTVPAGHVFAMGDNRDNSADSRDPSSGVGYVPIDNLVGRAEFIFFSIDLPPTSPWWHFWDWPLEIRWSRFFKGIT